MLTDDRDADNAAVGTHMASPVFARFVETEKKESNLAAPLQVLPLDQFAGFATRDGAKI